MAFNNAQLHPFVVFNNQGFRIVAAYFRYLRRFRDRPIYPSFSIHPSSFNKYDMNIPSLLGGLCGSSLVENMRFSYRREAAGMDGEFSELGFTFDAALQTLTRDIGRYYPSPLPAGRLYDDLKHLLAKLDAEVGPRKLVSGSERGGGGCQEYRF
ncbi:unnamed protein product [Linum trigynum]|uniref:Uncharacterized protein n=1 Tax=Linum trigynum TaxID=586398 RepID=A0AAV2CH12_9ROSI